ncbi:OB-fold domain-containing protein [Bosea sp. (in: a-proteobacteria)]|uniref:Zn-ribbon domain-containing OB-fold protein n=1 Tax=Bosea sp. (in: a-proteobacteria) TaxID=1871050 RepID=UPI0026144B77|nr:OB-fold domain-containing protein [Bosea sp. (in: a-proteobacteria)]MCO5090224.1 OB-fold domain-containing protein [Bosea sp. (in: a-proteobacteria)]
MGLSNRVLTLYDQPMWDSIENRRLALQRCDDCLRFRYPPGPICPHCLSMDHRWEAVSGRGSILSWVVFHRQYFDDFPPPYNAVAVQIAEGPIVVSNLVGDEPEGSWIGAQVEFVYRRQGDRAQHAVRLLPDGPVAGGSDQTAS